MSAQDRVVALHSDMNGEGFCPICHKPREQSGCSTGWTTKLNDGRIGDRGWEGHLNVFCRSYLNDRDALAEAMNRYHVRPNDVEDSAI